MSVLRPAADGPCVVVCNTCRFSAEERDGPDGRRGGAMLAEALRQVLEARDTAARPAVEETPCLFNCAQHCSVHLRAPGKIGYVLGRFEPTVEAAEAILDYMAAHAASAEGVVPYRQWPEGVKGHFIVRVPPPGFVISD